MMASKKPVEKRSEPPLIYSDPERNCGRTQTATVVGFCLKASYTACTRDLTAYPYAEYGSSIPNITPEQREHSLLPGLFRQQSPVGIRKPALSNLGGTGAVRDY